MKLLKKPSKKAVLFFLMGASVVMALWGAPLANRLRVLAHWVLAPLGQPGMSLTASVKSLTGGPEEVSPAEAGRLKEEVDTLRWRAQKAEEDLAHYLEQDALRQRLYGKMTDFPCEMVSAQVAASDSLPYGRTRLVNKGGSSGAEPGSRVVTLLTDRSKALPPKLATISSSALVGRLLETGGYYARLQLVTDGGFRIRARIIRAVDPNRPRWITVIAGGVAAQEQLSDRNNQVIEVEAQGDGVDGLVVREVKKYHNVQNGDWLVTAKDDAFLPEHVRIGRVVEVGDDPRNQLFSVVRVQPYADLAALKDVFIVVPLASKASNGAAGTRN